MRTLAVALLCLAPLAGCVADEPADAALGLDNATGIPQAPPAPPDNRTGTFNAFEETNRTEEGVGGMTHDHDYWLGRDRAVVLDRVVELAEYPASEGNAVEFGLPVGQTVYEGTAAVEVLVTAPMRHVCQFTFYTNGQPVCTDRNVFGEDQPAGRVPDPAPPTLTLWYQHAASSEWEEAGPLAWDAVLSIPVAPDETDMPHSLASLWRFRIVGSQAGADATSTFKLVATAVRGTEIVEWPGHPDFYAEKATRLIFEGTAATHESGYMAGLEQDDSFEQQAPNRLISYGTKSVHAWINVTSVKAPPGAVFGAWHLAVKNATGDWTRVDPWTPPADPAEPKDLYFVTAVDEAGMDSPYAADSRWEFFLYADLQFCAPDVCLLGASGFVAYDVEYAMTIVASSLEAPEPPPAA